MKDALEMIIHEALPTAMVEYCSNFDDLYYGWDICPKAGVLIRFNVNLNNEMKIKLVKYIIRTYDNNLLVKQMYFGDIPPDERLDPDFNFVKQILKNWKNIG